MPIRRLHEFLLERQLIQTESIDKLAGLRVGIDGNAWLRQLRLSEPRQVAMGGLPLTLEETVATNIAKWKQAGTLPTFVFNGVGVKRDRAPLNVNSFVSRVQKRQHAWETYGGGNEEAADAQFAAVEQSLAANFGRNVAQQLTRLGVQHMQAPYLAAAQLAWLVAPKQGLVQAVFGGLEALLFGAASVILSVDFEKRTYAFVELGRILQSLGLVPQQFQDACILAGFDYSATFPPLSTGKYFSFQGAYDLIVQARHGYGAVANYMNANPGQANYMEVYLKARAVVTNHLIFEPKGAVIPISGEDMPSDLHEIFGYRLPVETYFLMTQGVITSQVLNNLLHAVLVEAPPLVDTAEYRELLGSLLDVRSKAIAALSANLHETIAATRVVTVRWFDPDNELLMDHARFQPAVRALSCHLGQEVVDGILGGPPSSPTAPARAVGLHALSQLFAGRQAAGEACLVQVKKTEVVSTAEDFVAVVSAQALQLLGFLGADRAPTPRGRALAKFSRGDFGENAVVLLELLRYGALSGAPLTHAVPAHSPATDSAVALISRCVSLCPMQTAAEPWTAAVDRDLMGFNCIVKALHRSLRNVAEMLALGLLLRKQAKVPVRRYAGLATLLPFFQEESCAAGLVAKAFLEGQSVEQLAAAFPQCKDVAADLRQAFSFWDELAAAVALLHAEGALDAAAAAPFKEADAFLANRRPALG
mmetsp:Transcript_4646/g.16348  ORF Transcript_4646/g.16348 Transcript_4646/m.16348 type:complete len:704 (+) Transcript_4646:98-2209(+)